MLWWEALSVDTHRPALAQLVSRVHPLGQRTGWMVYVPNDATGFFPAALSEDGVLVSEVRVNGALGR